MPDARPDGSHFLNVYADVGGFASERFRTVRGLTSAFRERV
jgi:hypothetical protein